MAISNFYENSRRYSQLCVSFICISPFSLSFMILASASSCVNPVCICWSPSPPVLLSFPSPFCSSRNLSFSHPLSFFLSFEFLCHSASPFSLLPLFLCTFSLSFCTFASCLFIFYFLSFSTRFPNFPHFTPSLFVFPSFSFPSHFYRPPSFSCPLLSL